MEIHIPECCGCGANPPPSSNSDPDSSTLLSMRFGWRVLRQQDGKGGSSAEWRCPICWKKYKDAHAATKPASSRRP